MKIDEIKTIVKLMSDNDLTEFKIESEEMTLCLRRAARQQAAPAPVFVPAAMPAAAPAVPVPAAIPAVQEPVKAAPAESGRASLNPDKVIESPGLSSAPAIARYVARLVGEVVPLSEKNWDTKKTILATIFPTRTHTSVN